jgi:hypothetical protein|tara:strand:- start:593 stop:748 length:156 start_codon:yes stop_codon:yes gene_type:complete
VHKAKEIIPLYEGCDKEDGCEKGYKEFHEQYGDQEFQYRQVASIEYQTQTL